MCETNSYLTRKQLALEPGDKKEVVEGMLPGESAGCRGSDGTKAAAPRQLCLPSPDS